MRPNLKTTEPAARKHRQLLHTRRHRRAPNMDAYDFAHDMTDDQITLAKAAGKLARKQASGSTLYDALKIGEALLVGRAAAMRTAGVNRPFGKQYAHAFAAWKKQFGFTANKGLPLPPAYLDNCIFAAEHRGDAEQIIAELSPTQKAGMGISGLTARVRAKLKPELPASLAPRMTPTRQLQEQITGLTFAVDRQGLAATALRRCGLAIDENGDLMVFDEEKFMAWFAARRRPRLTIEGQAER
jgi:hypothetical protein